MVWVRAPKLPKTPLFGVFPDGTGVEDHNICTLGFLDDLIAALHQISPEFLRVGLILLTAVGLHVGGGCLITALPVGSNLIAVSELGIQLAGVNDGGFGIHGSLLRGI